MEIVLISPYGGITNLGIRYLASSLKKKKHSVKLVFLPERLGKRGDFDDVNSSYSKIVLKGLERICQKADLIGISVMTPYFQKAVGLTKFLKRKIKAPVIWGGIHPTVEPKECLKYADFICLGEGEEALLELVEKMRMKKEIKKTLNFWFKEKGKTVINPLRKLKQDLDSLPFPDYEIKNHYILDQGKIVALDQKLLQKYLPFFPNKKGEKLIAYPIFCTRGCPHGCSYCCNNALRSIYKGQKYIRRRSVGNIIFELEEIKRKFPFIKGIKIEDDSFLVANEQEISNFAKKYKEKINLPFICLSSPVNISEGKIKSLIETNLIGIQMGVQSGSDSLNRYVFNRPIPARQILKAATIIDKYKDKLTAPRYDIITDNPFESEKDLVKTIQVLSKIPGKYILNLYSLVFYPGTDLFKRVSEKGLIGDKEKIYKKDWLKVEMNYLKFLIFLNRFSFLKVPQRMTNLLLKKQSIKIGNKFNFFFRFIYNFIYLIRLKIFT